jgi:hypothetical protein
LLDEIDDAALATCERVLTVLARHREILLRAHRFRKVRQLGAVFSERYESIYAEQTWSKRARQRRTRARASMFRTAAACVGSQVSRQYGNSTKANSRLEELTQKMLPPADGVGY